MLLVTYKSPIRYSKSVGKHIIGEDMYIVYTIIHVIAYLRSVSVNGFIVQIPCNIVFNHRYIYGMWYAHV